MTRRAARSATRFFRISDVADCLEVSTRSVRRWIKSGALPVHRINGVVRISEADFAAFLRGA
jgi:excisionase family DNA binding protein